MNGNFVEDLNELEDTLHKFKTQWIWMIVGIFFRLPCFISGIILLIHYTQLSKSKNRFFQNIIWNDLLIAGIVAIIFPGPIGGIVGAIILNKIDNELSCEYEDATMINTVIDNLDNNNLIDLTNEKNSND